MTETMVARATPASDSKPPPSADCLNCGASLGGPFCAQCGQRALPANPTVRELVGDAWNELVGWDGKFLRTVRLLVLRPGELTRSAIEGRRARFITPVRLYLICSVLYFVVSAATLLPDTATFDASAGVGVSAPTNEGAAFEKALRVGLGSVTPDERATVEAYIADQPRLLRPMLERLAEDYGGFRRRIEETLPRALFLLVPALAAVLWLFYRRRHYPEHLYAALHLQTFVFLVLSLRSLAQPFMHSVIALEVAMLVAALIIVGHAIIAQQRVYGQSWPATALKAVAVAALYGALWGVTSVCAAMWVAMA
jgi:hypothetical protein